MDWRHEAACRDEDPELFFPIGNTGPALVQIEEAKAVCRRCSVVDECLRWALETGQDAGVWGGLSEDERRALKRRNARTRARTMPGPSVCSPRAERSAASARSHSALAASPPHARISPFRIGSGT